MSAKTQKQSGGGRKTAAKPRILYFDILRALAPVLVVIIHAALRYEAGTADFWGTRFRNAYMLRILCQVCIPAFVMISGALFLSAKRKFDMMTHFRKYVLRIAIIYLFWSVLYATLGLIFPKEGASQEATIRRFFAQLCGGHYYHLWFLLMLGVAYLLVPCLRKITESRALTELFLMLGIVFCFALPSLGQTFDLIREQNANMGPVVTGALSGMSDLFAYLSGKVGLKFIIYFVLGHYLASYDIKKKWRYFLYALGILGAIAAFYMGLWRLRLFGTVGEGADLQNINIGILAYGAAVFVFAKYAFGRVKKLPRLIVFMAKHSLGVYLVHEALVDFILYRIIKEGSQPLWILLPCSILIYATSLVISWALSKLPLLKKVVQ
ncbi:acyltransferase family protein [Candidatus Saccharibacteria bacterium]|nr:acyltransferase family protein [Candidatus Saccharibacteria bacterium]